MKIPRLRRWFCAVTPEEYAEFETGRTIAVSPVSVDIQTGRITGRNQIWLGTSVPAADTWLRQHLKLSGAVYVIGVPAHCVDRLRCRPHAGGWHYDRSIVVPGHCGVERVDLAS